MSYILEALKKAQAERQLGATPTIHAPTLDAAVPRGTGGARWKPLALAAGAVVIVGAAVLLWRQLPAPAVLTSAAQVAATAPVAASPAPVSQPVPPAALDAPAAAPSAAVPLPSAVPPAQPVAAPAQASVAPAHQAAPVPVPAPAPLARPAASAPAAPQAQIAPEPAKAQPPAPAPRAAEAPEEPVQLLRDLPEPIQRSIPQITMGGYMYSRNPADRLVLIDKILRHEGEEVAPGLVLEKLLPKAAIFTFKGYRYRVPY